MDKTFKKVQKAANGSGTFNLIIAGRLVYQAV